MDTSSYKQFCPVSMAAEILCARWTMVLLRELVAGSTRFNELRRGLPKMSPALLSKRLKSLEAAGILTRRAVPREKGIFEYQLTESGRELRPIVESIGFWGQKWIEFDLALQNLDVSLLMWDMRRNISFDPMPESRKVVEFNYADLAPAESRWWLIIDPIDGVDLCSVEPGYEIDLLISSDVETMTSVWMGRTTIRKAQLLGTLLLEGESSLASTAQEWLGLSPFARDGRSLDSGLTSN
ncbi:winged helix-turn-helix transcriptional regulator [Hyphobacterium sp.]|uniref:winged helix-turn-helix transcriptional regulator n=1 Tax=Hyphobacterium sp. TaxID=2004662 RepID=UPI003B528538